MNKRLYITTVLDHGQTVIRSNRFKLITRQWHATAQYTVLMSSSKCTIMLARTMCVISHAYRAGEKGLTSLHCCLTWGSALQPLATGCEAHAWVTSPCVLALVLASAACAQGHPGNAHLASRRTRQQSSGSHHMPCHHQPLDQHLSPSHCLMELQPAPHSLGWNTINSFCSHLCVCTAKPEQRW